MRCGKGERRSVTSREREEQRPAYTYMCVERREQRPAHVCMCAWRAESRDRRTCTCVKRREQRREREVARKLTGKRARGAAMTTAEGDTGAQTC